MLHEPEDYDFRDGVEAADFAVQVLKRTVPQLTRRQLECAYLLAYGLTQEQVGVVLGISRTAVLTHWQRHLDKVKEIGDSCSQNT